MASMRRKGMLGALDLKKTLTSSIGSKAIRVGFCFHRSPTTCLKFWGVSYYWGRESTELLIAQSVLP